MQLVRSSRGDSSSAMRYVAGYVEPTLGSGPRTRCLRTSFDLLGDVGELLGEGGPLVWAELDGLRGGEGGPRQDQILRAYCQLRAVQVRAREVRRAGARAEAGQAALERLQR